MKRLRSWRFAGLTAVALCVLAIGATAGFSALDRSAAGGIIIDGTSDSVTNIDPAGNYDFGSATLDYMLFEHLYEIAPQTGKLVPTLATKCAFKGGLKTYTCTLRQGVKFHNGDSFSSTDVKYSFDRVVKIKDPSGIYTLLSNLRSVTTSGPYGVTFHLKTAQSTWPLILTTGAGWIVDHTVYSATKVQANDGEQVGTGPYTLDKYVAGQQAVFKPFADYHGAKPKNDGVIVRYYTKSSTMKLALQKGDVNMAFREFTPTELASLGRAKGIKVNVGNGANIRYLVLNVTRAPTDKLAVRKAIAYLMPRAAIASRVYHGLVHPLYSQTPKGFPGQTDAFATVYGRSPSPAKAKAVLKAAGIAMPVPLEVWWTPSHYGDASADEYAEIKRALDASGAFTVTLKSAEWAQYSDALGKQYGAFQLGWFPDYPDAENYLIPFFQTGNFTSNGYSSKAMDALIKREQGAESPAQRYAILRQAQLLQAKDAPIIPYWQGSMIAVAKTSVKGIPRTLDPSFIMRFWLLSA